MPERKPASARSTISRSFASLHMTPQAGLKITNKPALPPSPHLQHLQPLLGQRVVGVVPLRTTGSAATGIHYLAISESGPAQAALHMPLKGAIMWCHGATQLNSKSTPST